MSKGKVSQFLGFSIEGPSQAKITCKDNHDGSAEISYLPTSPGGYAIHIMCNEEDIPGSPYMVDIQPFEDRVRPSYVRCHGPGLERRGVLRDQRTEFTVDAHSAGPANLRVWGLDREFHDMDISVRDYCSVIMRLPLSSE